MSTPEDEDTVTHPHRPDPIRWRRVQDLLDALLDLEAPEQARRLAALPPEDGDLRDEVAALLAHDRRASGPLDLPADLSFGELLAAAPANDLGADLAGREVGPYRILERLGEGGMAVVYAARQQNPSRTVALKIMRAGVLADARQRRRFQREAENLARLAHPCIAAIHDAGLTAEGLQYFAMERVEGEALDAYLRRRPAPIARAEIDLRLELFLAVCDAMTHAHQRGVIHLDLKPGNIMVLPASASGRSTAPPPIKVLDFGVARFIGADAGATMTQDDRGILGTLAYMSPEQAAGDRGAVDVRSDIYALGVLLHEMLTGALPLDFAGRSLPDAVRLIAEQPPPRPEDRVRLLRGDLATIIRKAMHVDAPQRYQSVAALAEDVQRTRDRQPILAQPPSTAYQLRKIVERHRTAIVFVGALAVTLMAAVAGTTFGLVRARQAEALAREEAAAAEEAARFLEQVFRVADPGESRGNAVTARELLDRAVADIDAGLSGQPRLQGRLLGTMGQAYRNLGLFREARPLLEQAVARQRETHGPDDPLTARSHFALAGLLRRLGDHAAAREHYAAALAIRERAFGAADPEVAASLTGLANLLVDLGDYEAARELYARALDILAATVGEDSPRYAAHLTSLAIADWNLGQLELARGRFERVVAVQRQALAADDLDLAWSLSALAALNEQTQRLDEARALCAEALAIQEAALGPDHADVAESLNVLANLHRRAGDFAQALAVHERAAAIWQRAVGAEHPTFAMALDHVAQDLGALGRLAEAIAAGERAREIIARALAEEHPSVATNLVILGKLHLEAGDRERARPHLERALALRQRHRPDRAEEIAEVQALLAAGP